MFAVLFVDRGIPRSSVERFDFRVTSWTLPLGRKIFSVVIKRISGLRFPPPREGIGVKNSWFDIIIKGLLVDWQRSFWNAKWKNNRCDCLVHMSDCCCHPTYIIFTCVVFVLFSYLFSFQWIPNKRELVNNAQFTRA